MAEKEPPKEITSQNQPVLHAILARRDCRAFLPKPIPKKDLEDILYAAIWAPNHKLTEPWRFRVITENSKAKFMEAYAAGIRSFAEDETTREKAEAKVEKMLKEFGQTAAFLAAACKTDPDPTLSRENLIATACGLQNMLLAAEEKGIAAHWTTSAANRSDAVQSFYGFAPDEHFVGLFLLGYPEKKGRMKRSPLEYFVRWV